LLLYDHGLLLCLWLGLSSSRVFPSSLLLDPPRLQHRPLELVGLVDRLRKISTPTHATQYKRPSMVAKGCVEALGRHACEAIMYSPGNLPDLGIHFPPFLERVSVFHGRTFPRVNNPQFIRCLGFPYPHVAVVRPRQYKPRICRKRCGKHPTSLWRRCEPSGVDDQSRAV